MRVVLDESLFAAPGADVLELLSLFDLGFKGRHYIQTDQPTPDAVCGWLEGRDAETRESCELALARSLERDALCPASKTVRVADVPHARWGDPPVVPLSAAGTLLTQPFYVIVEDATRDRDFLLAVATAERKCRLTECADRGWLKFEHGGGITRMRERVAELLQDRGKALRAWVLFDSDALRPGVPSRDSRRLAGACQRRVAFHQLSRRAVENYLPLPALETWANDASRKRKVRALRKLRKDQRFHYNMKRGFAQDAKRADSDAAGDLYDELDPGLLQALQHGIDVGIAELFNGKAFPIQGSWLHQDEQLSETEPMLDEMLSLL